MSATNELMDATGDKLWEMLKTLASQLASQSAILFLLAFPAFLLGILADTLIDKIAFGVLEQHHRLHFALSHRKSWNEEQWRKEPWSDPYPEGVLRGNMTEENSKSVEGLRQDVRLMRTLTFFLPCLAYSLAVAVVRWQHLRHCVARDGTASPDWCSAAWDFGILRIQVPEHGVWPLLGPLLVAWGLILTLWLVAGRVDLYLYNLKLYHLPLRSGEADTADTIVFEPRDKRSFKWRRSHRWSPFKACRWNPPRTDCPELDFAELGRIAGDADQAIDEPVGIFCALPVIR
jgi:hypothetical protein